MCAWSSGKHQRSGYGEQDAEQCRTPFIPCRYMATNVFPLSKNIQCRAFVCSLKQRIPAVTPMPQIRLLWVTCASTSLHFSTLTTYQPHFCQPRQPNSERLNIRLCETCFVLGVCCVVLCCETLGRRARGPCHTCNTPDPKAPKVCGAILEL